MGSKIKPGGYLASVTIQRATNPVTMVKELRWVLHIRKYHHNGTVQIVHMHTIPWRVPHEEVLDRARLFVSDYYRTQTIILAQRTR